MPKVARIRSMAAAFLSGIVLMSASGNKGALGWAAWGALAGGIGSYALGYYSFGGKDCNQADVCRTFRQEIP